MTNIAGLGADQPLPLCAPRAEVVFGVAPSRLPVLAGQWVAGGAKPPTQTFVTSRHLQTKVMATQEEAKFLSSLESFKTINKRSMSWAHKDLSITYTLTSRTPDPAWSIHENYGHFSDTYIPQVRSEVNATITSVCIITKGLNASNAITTLKVGYFNTNAFVTE